jgi:hypothetical protein
MKYFGNKLPEKYFKTSYLTYFASKSTIKCLKKENDRERNNLRKNFKVNKKFN